MKWIITTALSAIERFVTVSILHCSPHESDFLRSRQMTLGVWSISRIVLVSTVLMLTPWNAVVAAINSVGGYFTPSDNFQHAIVQTTDDALHELFFSATSLGKSDLGCFGHVTAIASFYAADDKTEHVIVSQQDGGVREVFFNSKLGVHQTPAIINVPSTVSLAAFYDENTKDRVVILATSGGEVFSVLYNSKTPAQRSTLGTFPGIVAVSGFYSSGDKIDHAIVLTSDGKITEIFFNQKIGVHITLPALTTIPGAIALGSFYSANDKIGHVIVGAKNGSITEVFYGAKIGVHITEPSLAVLPGLVSVAAYATESDHGAHVIVGLDNGTVHQLFYSPTVPPTDKVIANVITGPQVEDISPDQRNAKTITADGGWAGLMVNLAGGEPITYAVSLNDGVWRSTNDSPWSLILNSPRYATSIAVDPNNSNNLAVGERDGDGAISTNHNGLWVSSNSGATWSMASDPTSNANCNSQAIPSVVYSAKSTLFFATTCGIGRIASGGTVDYSASPSGLGAVTAVAISASKVWARTATQLLFSTDDGLTWTTKTIPSTFSNDGRGTDAFSLAAFDNAAYANCCSVAYDKDCGNQDQMMIYDAIDDKFLLQPILWVNNGNTKDSVGNPISELGCSGTGLGGSRFTRATVIGRTNHLYYGSAEEVYEATSLDSQGQVKEWERPLGATCPGCTNQDPVHSDIWDFMTSSDGKTEWAANDGGIYIRKNGGQWTPHSEGLHTHLPLTVNELRYGTQVRLVYPTPDNDGWSFNASGGANGWLNDIQCGDENWSVGDNANPSLAVIVRTNECAYLHSFAGNLSTGTPYKFVTLNHDPSRTGPGFFNFVQSQETDTPAALLLDAAMMVNLPLQFRDANGLHNVPGILGQTTAVGINNPVIIRTKDYVANGDIDTTKYGGWTVLANNLPAGAERFWTAGGHQSPTVYLLAVEGNTPTLWKAEGLGTASQTNWQQINPAGSVLDKMPWPSTLFGSDGCVDGNGFDICRIVHVDSFDPQRLWVLTSNGVQVSTNGGFSFSVDQSLTNLITHNGQFPLTSNFGGGAGNNVRIGSHIDPVATLSDMAFCRTNPDIAVASSAFGGVFFKDEDNVWHDLTSLLPQPATYMSGVQIDCEAIYAASAGGGIFRITGYRGVR